MDEANKTSLVTSLFEAAVWQDSLLQSYRLILLTLESVFLAISAGLTVGLLNTESDQIAWLTACVLFLLAIISVGVLVSMRKVILSRGEDVTWWHVRIIRAEQSLPVEDRHFTRFKLDQRMRRKNLEDIHALFMNPHPCQLNDEQVTKLVGRGLGHTRKIIDVWLVWAILLMWLVVLGVVIVCLSVRFF